MRLHVVALTNVYVCACMCEYVCVCVCACVREVFKLPILSYAL